MAQGTVGLADASVGSGGNMRQVLVSTTIHVPEVLRKYRELGPDVPFIIAGDKKTPPRTRHLVEGLGGRYLSPHDQEQIDPTLSDAIGWNCVQRRNIAILEAAKLKPDVIVSVDDDNAPKGDYFAEIERAFSEPHTGRIATGDYFNIGTLAAEQFIYRGFPRNGVPFAKNSPNGRPRKIGILNGLIFGDPDINATQRLEGGRWVTRYTTSAQEGIAVDPGKTWTPVNAQNTAYRAELAPLMMQLPRVGRYDDIWGSYIAQRVLAGTEWSILFGKPWVHQDRNEQDIITNLEDEIYGMRHTPELLSWLDSLALPGGSVLNRLRAVLTALESSGLDLPFSFFYAWLAAFDAL